jgi:ankyrin repeat protein
MQILINNVFNACRKNNFIYIERNKERINVEKLCSRDYNQNTPLYIAVANRHMDTVKYLIERGVPVDLKNEGGNTCMHKAFMNQDYDMIVYLKNYGGSFDSINNFNQTPLFFGSLRLLDKLGISKRPVTAAFKKLTPSNATMKRVNYFYI